MTEETFDFCVLATPPSLWDSSISKQNAGNLPQGFIEVRPSLEKHFPKPCQMGSLVKYLTCVKERFWQKPKEVTADYSWAQTWESISTV